jgi:hypothetical protein
MQWPFKQKRFFLISFQYQKKNTTNKRSFIKHEKNANLVNWTETIIIIIRMMIPTFSDHSNCTTLLIIIIKYRYWSTHWTLTITRFNSSLRSWNQRTNGRSWVGHRWRLFQIKNKFDLQFIDEYLQRLVNILFV